MRIGPCQWPAGSMAGMDEVGRRYQALALRIGRHMPEYIDFWLGDPMLREVIAAEEPAPPVELHVEAVALHEAAAALPADDAPAAQRRGWLLAQLGAMSAITRRLGGEEIAFADLVEVLFEMSVAETPATDVDRAHAILDDALPPGPSLRDRLAAHDDATRMPKERSMAALVWLLARLRERTRQDVGLPDGESIELVAAPGMAGGAAAPYVGELQTRIELNTELPMTLGGAVYLAAHEGYPGHHAERANKEVALWRARDLGEAAVACIYTPEIAISEGLGELARGIVLGDQEFGGMLRDLAGELELPIPPSVLEREVTVERARELMRDLTADAAYQVHQLGLPEAEVRATLAERALRRDDRIEHDMRWIGDPLRGAYTFAYAAGRRVILPWLEKEGQTAGFTRLLSEQLSPGQLRADLGEPRALYPGSLV
jgi:hypothetical protein